MFSALTFRVQNARLFLCPLAVAFANDTNICLCSVLSLMQPSLRTPPNNFLWSKFKANLLTLASICHHMCQPSCSQLGWAGRRQKVTFYTQCVLQEAGESRRKPNFPSTWQELNAFFPFSFAFHSPVRLGASGSRWMCSGQMKMNQIPCKLWELVLLSSNSRSCDAFP